ncbi:MAG: hypothetical protein CMO63_01825 [Verrucomicrobiales bacterium]|nr:hypothetical protein [Verrucomicrobiales bacterium]
MDLSLSGLASGFDWKSVVDQLVEIERAPQRRARREQYDVSRRNQLLGNIKDELSSVESKAKLLKDEKLYQSRTTAVSDESVGAAKVESGAALGSYKFEFFQRATTAEQKGGTDAGRQVDWLTANGAASDGATSLTVDTLTTSLSNGDVVVFKNGSKFTLDADAAVGATSLSGTLSGNVLDDENGSTYIANNGFGVKATTGSFTINDSIITVETTDSLASIFKKITDADSDLSVAYDASSDKITLSSVSGKTLVMGSSNDTSNFLTASRLNNNGTSSVSSVYKLGGISMASTLAGANFNTTLIGTTGSFRVNGKTIDWASDDTVGSVLAGITQSGAGVVASYDGVNDRFLLTNTNTGDVGISLEDVRGNFLQAVKLSSETIQADGAQSASVSVSVNNATGYGTGDYTSSGITVDSTASSLSSGDTLYFENGGKLVLSANASAGATTLYGTLTGATLTNDETGYKSGTFNISASANLTVSSAATAKSVKVSYSSGYSSGATSLSVDSLGAALSSGDVIRFGNGTTFTLDANADANDTTLSGTLSGGSLADNEVGYLVQSITVGSNSENFSAGDRVRFANGGILTITADPASGATTLTGSLSANLSASETSVSRSESFRNGQSFHFVNGSKLTLTADAVASSTSLTGYWTSAVSNSEEGDQAALTRGNDMLYSLNGGDILTSHSNTVTEDSSGVSGLSVTANLVGAGHRIGTVDNSNNVLTTTTSHGLTTGDLVKFYAPSTLMSGVSSQTTYYVRALSGNKVSLHTSSSDATAGSNAVNISDSGTGDQYLLNASANSLTATVASDTDKVKNAIKDFVSQISKTQSLISMHTAVTTDSDGKVTAGALSNDRLVAEIGAELRSKTMGEMSGAGSSYSRLSDLGFAGNGYDNQINLKDETALDTALRESMGDVQKFFATETVTDYGDGATADYSEAEGMADVVQDYTALLLGDFYVTDGALVDHRDNYTKEIDRIENRIAELEKRAQAVKDQLTRSFVEMEKAQAKTNQEMQFLTKRFA